MLSNRPLMLGLCLGISTLLASCAQTPKTLVVTAQVPVANSLRLPCPRPDLPSVPSSGDPSAQVRAIMAFSIRQEAAINICEGRKDSLVAVIDQFNRSTLEAAYQQRPWWKRLPLISHKK